MRDICEAPRRCQSEKGGNRKTSIPNPVDRGPTFGLLLRMNADSAARAQAHRTVGCGGFPRIPLPILGYRFA